MVECETERVQKGPKIGVSSMVLCEEKLLLGRRKGSLGVATWATPCGGR